MEELLNDRDGKRYENGALKRWVESGGDFQEAWSDYGSEGHGQNGDMGKGELFRRKSDA